MLKNKIVWGLWLCSATLIFILGCKKNDKDSVPTPSQPTINLPTVFTSDTKFISSVSANCIGNVTSDGGATVTDRGICYSTAPAPTTSGTKLSSGSGKGEIGFYLINLTPSTTYYVRAYAINSKGTAYGAEKSFTTTATSVIDIGYFYQGGIIFYTDGTGHGLIAAPYDQGTFNWGCEGTSVSGTSTVVGSGQVNTTNIVNTCGTSNIAARVCDNLTLYGYSDWFLPSKDELKLMHHNLHLLNIGGFSMNRYWSSSQFNGQFAWCQLFSSNLEQLYYDKDLIAYPVRAARSF